jgi:hypothetical protein
MSFSFNLEGFSLRPAPMVFFLPFGVVFHLKSVCLDQFYSSRFLTQSTNIYQGKLLGKRA